MNQSINPLDKNNLICVIIEVGELSWRLAEINEYMDDYNSQYESIETKKQKLSKLIIRIFFLVKRHICRVGRSWVGKTFKKELSGHSHFLSILNTTPQLQLIIYIMDIRHTLPVIAILIGCLLPKKVTTAFNPNLNSLFKKKILPGGRG